MLLAGAAMLVLALGAALVVVLAGALGPKQEETEDPAERELDGVIKLRDR